MRAKPTALAGRCARLGAALALLLACGTAAAQSAAPPALSIEVQRFVVEGKNPLSAEETDALLKPYLGVHHDLDALEQAAETLEKRMRDRGYSFHRVIVPAQKPAGGEIRLQVLEFVLDKIAVSGNQQFSVDNIRASLPALKSGQAPDLAAIGRDLATANEHPSKRITLVFKEGEKPDAVDAELRVREAPPVQTFVGLSYASRDADNATNRNTGYARLTLGHQRTNLFDRDHALTLSYTTSPDHLSEVTQLAAFYWLPLYGYSSTLTFWATYSDVNSGTITAGNAAFQVTGSGEFYGLRYTWLLPRWLGINHNASLSVEDKYFDNRVSSATLPVATGPARTRPLTLRYQARSDFDWGAAGVSLDYASNLSGGGANSDLAYAQSTSLLNLPGPTLPARSWDLWRYGLEGLYALGRGWNLTARLRGQWSDQILLSQEQFGLGGSGAVRGLKDRELSGERGYAFTLEAAGPGLVWEIQPVVFYDQGAVVNRTPGAVRSAEHVGSLGAGLRWNWRRQLDLAMDWAHVLDGLSPVPGSNNTRAGHNKLYLSVFYRF